MDWVKPKRPSIRRAAVDHIHVKLHATVVGAGEIAFFRPTTAGEAYNTVTIPITVCPQQDTFDISREIHAPIRGGTDIVAVVRFSGAGSAPKAASMPG